MFTVWSFRECPRRLSTSCPTNCSTCRRMRAPAVFSQITWPCDRTVMHRTFGLEADAVEFNVYRWVGLPSFVRVGVAADSPELPSSGCEAARILQRNCGRFAEAERTPWLFGKLEHGKLANFW